MNVNAKVHLLNMQKFSADRMADEIGLYNALNYLEYRLDAPDANVEAIIEGLLSIPNLFAYIMSIWPRAPEFVDTILNLFPTEPNLFLKSSTRPLLLGLSDIIFSLPAANFLTETSRTIGRYKIYVENALPALTALTTEDFHQHTTASIRPTGRRGERRGSIIEASLFERLGVQVPSNAAKAAEMAGEIMRAFEEILCFYLKLLLDSDLASALKDSYTRAVGCTTTSSEAVIREPEPSPTVAGPVVTPAQEPAHTVVQPMEIALYFDNADGFGEWRILMSDSVTRGLRALRNSDKNKVQMVVKKIKQLSNGNFSGDNQRRLDRSSPGVPIFEARIQHDLRLVYLVDCTPDVSDITIEKQVIRIYGIHEDAQVNRRVWHSVGRQLARKGKEYRRRCTSRISTGNNIYLPAGFPSSAAQSHADPIEPDTTELDITESDATEPHTADPVTGEDENELHDLLVLQKYVNFSQPFLNELIANEEIEHVFELSPRELEVIQCSGSCYVLGRSGTGKTTTMLLKMLGIQRAWELQKTPGTPKPRQIFVTKSPVLAEKVEEYFQKLLGSMARAVYTLKELAKLKAHSTDVSVISSHSLSSIPRSYRALEDHHFPLFVNFDTLASMIAEDVRNTDTKHKVTLYQSDSQRTFVSYSIFAKTYWPHFSQQLTKGFDPWLVFAEFMGVIKGSEKSLTFSDGCLDVETYRNLSPRTNPTFADQRDTIYSIFQAYCKLKRQRRQHDMADRTHAILKALSNDPFLEGHQVDYLYVDEAQDNLLTDALLLRRICRNPDGLFWAGDTAQTISAGSSFRLDDLRAFMYRVEKEKCMPHVPQPASPTLFQLTVNYRSHGGIVDCANSVVELIVRFWPKAIDKLRPERGMIVGPKPIFIDVPTNDQDHDDSAGYIPLLFGASDEHIEFGAQQCILVRDDDVREELRRQLREQVGRDDIGLIMTLYDSKGLEFNDVFLYNFFASSTVTASQWRVVLSALENPQNSVDFGVGANDGICSELKRLYVGITRARKRLCVIDKSAKCQPMQKFWTSRSLVETCTASDAQALFARLAVSSTSEEWAASGHSMLQHMKYSEAIYCFARAGLPHERAVAEAYQFREDAFHLPPGQAQNRAFSVAGDKLKHCASEAPTYKDRRRYHYDAAGCYDSSGDNGKAAEAYIAAQEYGRAARQYQKAERFAKALQVLRKYSDEISTSCRDEVITACKIYYYSRNIEPPLSLFLTVEEELSFLTEHKFTLPHAKRLDSLERYYEAAELYLAAKQPMDAIRAFNKDTRSPDASNRAADILLKCLWRRCSFATPPNKVAKDKDVAQLLALADDLRLDVLDPVIHDEICMFRAIAQDDVRSLEKLAMTFFDRHDGDVPALLAFDHTFSSLPSLESFTAEEMSVFLHKFSLYIQLLSQVISHHDPLRENKRLQLFCISEISSNEYRVEPESALYGTMKREYHGSKRSDPSNMTSTRNVVVPILRSYLSSRLQERVSAENKACCKAAAFSPCLPFIVNGRCDRKGCPQAHISLSSLNSEQYNVRVGLHLKQMHILQVMFSTNPHLERLPTMMNWLSYLYEALFPPFYVQGNIADLDRSRNRVGIVKEWVRYAIDVMDPFSRRDEFLTAITRLIKLAITFDHGDATQYLRGSPCVISDRPPKKFCNRYGTYIVEDMLTFMEGYEQSCIPSGVEALNFILQKSLPVHLSVLCDYVEEICSSIVISLRLEISGDSSLHDVVLPCTWLINESKFARHKQIDYIGLFMKSVELLLDRLHNCRPKEVFRLTDAQVTPVHRNIFISRMMLCFLGRIPVVEGRFSMISMVKERISKLLGSLKRDGHIFYSKYTETSGDKYLDALQFYDEGIQVNDLVHLVHESKKGRISRIPQRIPQIVYGKPEQIPQLVLERHKQFASPAALPGFVPRSVYASNIAPTGRRVDVQRKRAGAEAQVGVEPRKDESTQGEQTRGDMSHHPVVNKIQHDDTGAQPKADSVVEPSGDNSPEGERIVGGAPLRPAADKPEDAQREHANTQSADDNSAQISDDRPSKGEQPMENVPHSPVIDEDLQHQHAGVRVAAADSAKPSNDKPSQGDQMIGDTPSCRVVDMIEDVQREDAKVQPGTNDSVELLDGQQAISSEAEDEGTPRCFPSRPQIRIDVDDVELFEGEQEMATSLFCSVMKTDQVSRSPGLQDTAARVLQAAYRRHCLRRLQIRTETNPEVRAAFEACLKQDQFAGWEPCHYRLLYLGPLPHLLAGLDEGILVASTVKDKIKEIWAVDGQEKTEELSTQRNRVVSLLKQGYSLRRKLEPTAPFHEKRDIEALRQAVMDVRTFVQSIPGDTQKALSEIDIAYKAIVAEKQAPMVLDSGEVTPGI